ncbi:MAG: NADH-quinone oxidoreductase subunit NuoG [Anaerolineaceae bacterium]|nr:NADH-quinone oxidoreductase subunit NuoG [Anaerolineaceae bacterium]
MGAEVTLTIDGKTITVPKGMLVVDAAKKAGINIPVFCYHPKMEPVGMCRMCLVEIGTPMFNRETKEAVLNGDGSPQIRFFPKLETACTTVASEGMVVITDSEKVKGGRKGMLEFFLTSHPLDCPVCDKGGECPLQNLTMEYGPQESRFKFEEKMSLDKRVPLGDLIILDRERCIQCGRCVRFSRDIVDDSVLAFFNRGRHTDIMTFSEPGFDSIFSGNVTDICPVGALTTADFRFGARPWEMISTASICSHCAVGCNIVHDVRREARSGGNFVIKRVMPRQNEMVNEMWICDKGRFGYHHTQNTERITQPLMRKESELQPVSWDEALSFLQEKLVAAGNKMISLASGRLSNEDLFYLSELTIKQGGQSLLYGDMAGGELIARAGLSAGSNLADLGEGDVVLVMASDLHEEAPLYWLRVKQAAERGAALIVANPRKTRLDKFASHILRYEFGEEAKVLEALISGNVDGVSEASNAFTKANNAVVFYGSEGVGLQTSRIIAGLSVELLEKGGHLGLVNNGLIPVWPHGNTQGAWDMGFEPADDLADQLANANIAYLAGVDPASDSTLFSEALKKTGLLVVHELFMTETALIADLVFPVQAYTEREGTFTSAERRVQRYYPAVPPLQGTWADFSVIAELSCRLGRPMEAVAASLVMEEISETIPGYEDLSYALLSQTEKQWPDVSRDYLNYGGTHYQNDQGLGVQLSLVEDSSSASGKSVLLEQKWPEFASNELIAVPGTKLYDRGALLQNADLLNNRLAKNAVWIHPDLGRQHNLSDGEQVIVRLSGDQAELEVCFDESLSLKAAMIPRSMGLWIDGPEKITIEKIAETGS